MQSGEKVKVNIGKNASIAVLALFAALAPAGAATDQQNAASSQPPAGQQVAAGTPEAKKGPNLTGWWRKGAMEYHPLPKQWLFHGEAIVSFMDAKGNTDGTSLEITGSADLRKSRFTSH